MVERIKKVGNMYVKLDLILVLSFAINKDGTKIEENNKL